MDHQALRTLLAESIDYAGLFPPAALGMPEAVSNYAAYRRAPEAWMLGRFIVPAAQLDAFAATRQALSDPEPWTLSVLLADVRSDLAAISRFQAERPLGAAQPHIDTVEFRATSTAAIADALRLIPEDLVAYVEVPLGSETGELVGAIASGGGRAKIRMGGVEPAAFPDAEAVLDFLTACTARRLPFKATAGLHHPLRGDYRLTYAPDSPSGPMFGFLNVFLATAALYAGWKREVVRELLCEADPQALRAHDDGVAWRDKALSLTELAAGRLIGVIAIGSCSFTEPVADLTAYQWLERTHQA